ncbi:MAG: hypothetical protein K0R65_830 [Crocinitomicaceae bacterium]|jgi:hypothetical protein|nr:hypothetical protein [Crocinitomicaceae bacterium]
MKYLVFSLLTLFLSSCVDPATDKDVFNQPVVKKKDKGEVSFEERMRREVEAKLSIPATEKYKFEIKKGYLNADEKEDAVITVNRLELAKYEAEKEKGGNRKELGYMGNYNFFFYYDGKIDKLSIPMPIGSSAKSPLKVSFENVQSEVYQDLIIEYRIRNSAFRNYYVIENGSLALVFQWKLFDMAGTDQYEANYIEYAQGSRSLAKDIIIYKGKIKNYSPKIPDVYQYNPEIEKDGPQLYRFFYDPASMKYMTQKQ